MRKIFSKMVIKLNSGFLILLILFLCWMALGIFSIFCYKYNDCNICTKYKNISRYIFEWQFT